MRQDDKRTVGLKAVFWLSVLAYGLMCAVLPLIPLRSRTGSVFQVVLGILFWAFLLGGVLLTREAALQVRDRLAAEDRYQWWRKRRPGVLRFCTGLAGMIADGVLALCIVATVVFAFLNNTYYTIFTLRAITLASICAHCIFNGRTFEYIQQRKGREERRK